MLVLVVDGDKKHADLVAAAIETDGLTTVDVRGVEEALSIINRRAPDAAIVNADLADGSGRELCATLRQTIPSLPIILLSKRSDTIAIIAALNAGADDYLTIPFEPSELGLRFRNLIRLASMTSSAREDPDRICAESRDNPS